jgi:hypothetical protein
MMDVIRPYPKRNFVESVFPIRKGVAYILCFLFFLKEAYYILSRLSQQGTLSEFACVRE